MVSCTDSGVGIDPGALPHIFSPFEQAHRDDSQSFGGLGLGLAIARGLVAEHGGSLEASSAGPGRGATFTLRLVPLAQQPEGAPRSGAEPASAVPAGGTAPREACRLLLVEDNQDAADSMAMWLEECGYTVTHVATCAAALDIAARQAFDIIVTDLGLPDGSGIEIGRALSPSMPVIALSGFGAPQDVARSREAGFAGHLVKPVELDAMETMLRSVLAEQQAATAG